MSLQFFEPSRKLPELVQTLEEKNNPAEQVWHQLPSVGTWMHRPPISRHPRDTDVLAEELKELPQEVVDQSGEKHNPVEKDPIAMDVLAAKKDASPRAAQLSASCEQQPAQTAESPLWATAKAAAGGAVVLGTGGGAAGLATGVAAGTGVGLIMAPFTFGLSLPIAVAVGSMGGLVTGSAAGSTFGAIGGGAAGYHRHHKKLSVAKLAECEIPEALTGA